MTLLQYNVVLRRASLGPRFSKMDPYANSNSKLAGLTKAIAKGNAPGLSGYPVALDVNREIVIGRAKL